MSDLDAVYRDAMTTRLLRRMSHALQHDLKSPVQGIYWSLELALKGVSGEGVDAKTRAQVEKAVSMARKELARLERTSRTFLADAGISDEGAARFDLADLAKETVRHFVTDAAMRNVRLTVDTPPDAVYVHAPRAEIAQAVLTCVLHSLDSVPTGGTAEVFVRREGANAVMEVTDNATQAADAATEFGMGTLGLRIARQFVEAHGGELRTRPAEGGGRRMTCVRLPLDLEAASA
jgi:signal transduction histidine kinase